MKYRKTQYGLWAVMCFYFRIALLVTSAMYVLKLLFALLPFLMVIASAQFVDRAIAVSREGYGAALRSAFLIAFLMLIREVGSSLYAFLRTRQWSRAYPVIDRMITEKISLLPYSEVENDAVQDLLSRVREDPEGLLSGIMEGYMGLGGFLISNVSLVAVLVAQAPVWVSFVICSLLCLFGIFAVKGGEKQYNARAEVTLRRRKAEYYGNILGSRDMADERMLFQYGDAVNEMFLEESREARRLERKARRWWFVGMNIGAYMAIGISVMVIFTLMIPVLQGKTSVGLFVSLVTAFMSMTQNITWQFPNMLKDIASGRRMLGDFGTVLQMPEYTDAVGKTTCTGKEKSAAYIDEAENSVSVGGTKKHTPNDDVQFESLEFRNVSFSYPGTGKEVLKGISFRMESGRHYAFAGRNGCGKSTIVKLILRLYEPNAGKILVNGRDIREYDVNQIWAMFAVLFQDYARYPLTVYENIALGGRAAEAWGKIASVSNLQRAHEASEPGGQKRKVREAIALDDSRNKEPKEEKATVLQAASAAGLDDLIKKLPGGMDTDLGKLSENSVDLSGGEWQRVAMARMNYSRASVRILDEPTAAMDPVQEQTVYRQFSDMNRNATTIMITHRLGATYLSDCIFVIEDGRVMEEGSHNVLMEKQGIYREMYEKQREWYL